MKQELLKECEKHIGKAISDAMSSYNSPLVRAIQSSLSDVEPQLKEMADFAIYELTSDDEFKSILNTEVKRKLAKVLISKIGGEIESTVGKLKSDPVTRSKITIAIDSVMSDIAKDI